MIRQRGYSLIELMLVISVIAIATIGIIATYLTVNFNRKVNQTYDDLGEIVQNVEQAWGNMQSYNGLTAQIGLCRDEPGNALADIGARRGRLQSANSTFCSSDEADQDRSSRPVCNRCRRG